jgi:molybdopterin converting factor small subunit
VRPIHLDQSVHHLQAEHGVFDKVVSEPMKVNIQFFLPGIKDAIGANEVQVVFSGTTLGELIDHLITEYGPMLRKALFDEHGNLDPLVQILHNGEQWVLHDQLDLALHDGDKLVFLLMMAGG